MELVSFRMSGSGSWQNLLPDESSRRLYAEIYPKGAPWPKDKGEHENLMNSWRQASVVRLKGQNVFPLGPVMTDDDLATLSPWFQDISDIMCEAVRQRLNEYRRFAVKLAGGPSPGQEEIDNILTIEICAHTLDAWVFASLRQNLIGDYPARGSAGRFFFWGYAFASGPERIFGFTTYGGSTRKHIHMIRSHGLDRRAIKEAFSEKETWSLLYHFLAGRFSDDETFLWMRSQDRRIKDRIDILKKINLLIPGDPPSLAIPVFSSDQMESNSQLYEEVGHKIISRIMGGLDELKAMIDRCSFVECSRGDVLCMLFHLAYSYAADKLVEEGMIPDFPKKAGGEWGVWVQ
jgi:hypothetical protein